MSASDFTLSSAAPVRVNRKRLAVFAPLALAFIGLAIVAGIGAGKQGAMLAANTPVGIDPMVTGSIAPADEHHAMEMLDR